MKNRGMPTASTCAHGHGSMTWQRAGIDDVATSMGQAYADGQAIGIDLPPHGPASDADR